ncbi:unnamed protein product [Amoebophrya sp. A120]|nr:unnamed protein product [Amoebophrya sp. A120]|eukprot:GSA120T00025860001.1
MRDHNRGPDMPSLKHRASLQGHAQQQQQQQQQQNQEQLQQMPNQHHMLLQQRQQQQQHDHLHPQYHMQQVEVQPQHRIQVPPQQSRAVLQPQQQLLGHQQPLQQQQQIWTAQGIQQQQQQQQPLPRPLEHQQLLGQQQQQIRTSHDIEQQLLRRPQGHQQLRQQQSRLQVHASTHMQNPPLGGVPVEQHKLQPPAQQEHVPSGLIPRRGKNQNPVAEPESGRAKGSTSRLLPEVRAREEQNHNASNSASSPSEQTAQQTSNNSSKMTSSRNTFLDPVAESTRSGVGSSGNPGGGASSNTNNSLLRLGVRSGASVRAEALLRVQNAPSAPASKDTIVSDSELASERIRGEEEKRQQALADVDREQERVREERREEAEKRARAERLRIAREQEQDRLAEERRREAEQALRNVEKVKLERTNKRSERVVKELAKMNKVQEKQARDEAEKKRAAQAKMEQERKRAEGEATRAKEARGRAEEAEKEKKKAEHKLHIQNLAYEGLQDDYLKAMNLQPNKLPPGSEIRMMYDTVAGSTTKVQGIRSYTMTDPNDSYSERTNFRLVHEEYTPQQLRDIEKAHERKFVIEYINEHNPDAPPLQTITRKTGDSILELAIKLPKYKMFDLQEIGQVDHDQPSASAPSRPHQDHTNNADLLSTSNQNTSSRDVTTVEIIRGEQSASVNEPRVLSTSSSGVSSFPAIKLAPPTDLEQLFPAASPLQTQFCDGRSEVRILPTSNTTQTSNLNTAGSSSSSREQQQEQPLRQQFVQANPAGGAVQAPPAHPKGTGETGTTTETGDHGGVQFYKLTPAASASPEGHLYMKPPPGADLQLCWYYEEPAKVGKKEDDAAAAAAAVAPDEDVDVDMAPAAPAAPGNALQQEPIIPLMGFSAVSPGDASSGANSPMDDDDAAAAQINPMVGTKRQHRGGAQPQ